MADDDKDSGDLLRDLIEASGLTQPEALARFNRGQARKVSLRSLKGYMAKHGSKTRVRCPDGILRRMRTVLQGVGKVQACTACDKVEP